MSEGPAKEYSLVCPDFGTDGLCLDHDTQARCLQYIARHIFGEAYPSLGIPAEDAERDGEVMTDFSITLGDQITEYIQALGVRALAALSATETVTWAEIAQEKSP